MTDSTPTPLLTAVLTETPENFSYPYATAPTVQDLIDLRSRADSHSYRKGSYTRPYMRNRTRIVCLPTAAEQFNAKLIPALRLDPEITEDFHQQLGVEPLHPRYWRVAYLLNRQNIFLSMADEGFIGEPMAAAGLRARIRLWHASRLKRAIVDLLDDGAWVDNPAPSSGYALLNSWMRLQDLGRQAHMGFSSTPRQRARFGPGHASRIRALIQAAVENPLVRHARALPADQRRAYLAANPGTAWLYAQAYPGESPAPNSTLPAEPAPASLTLP